MAYKPVYFFDASAIVKIFLDEPGAESVRAIFRNNAPIHTSWVLVAEAMAVFKRKWRRSGLSAPRYTAGVYQLFKLLKTDRLHPVDLTLRAGRPVLKTYDYGIIEIRRKYDFLDAADAVQLLAIREGVLKFFAGPSEPQLVSGDRKLLRVAKSEGIRVVDVRSDWTRP